MSEFVPTDLDSFTQAYLKCAEWLLDEEIDRDSVEGWSNEAINEARKDCADFQECNTDSLEKYYEVTGRDEASAGHDFWLTRNRHGAGFWDRGTHPVLRELTDSAHAYGETDAYLGDDNLLYLS